MNKLSESIKSRIANRQTPTTGVQNKAVVPLTDPTWLPIAAPGASVDLRRILALPTRAPAISLAEISEIEHALRAPGGTQTLFPAQARALRDLRRGAHRYIGHVCVGDGKTLITFLAPGALGVRRAVLLLPANLYDKTFLEYAGYARHWCLPPLHEWRAAYGTAAEPVSTSLPDGLYVVPYERLQRQDTADILERIDPELLVFDEGHCAFGKQSARRKRVLRRLRVRPTTKLVVLSGSLLRDDLSSIMDIAKIVLRERSPLPVDYFEQETWANALNPDGWGALGALKCFVPPGEEPTASSARAGVKNRLAWTPGVGVSEASDGVDVGLVLYCRDLAPPPEVRKALVELRTKWKRPDGVEFSSVLDFSRYARQLAAGNYLRWNPAPSVEWLEARNAFNREVRTFLERRASPGLDTPGLLEKAAEAGAWASAHYLRWVTARDLEPEPPTEVVWLSDFLIQDAVAWAKEHGPGIIWYEQNTALGEAIAAAGDFAHFGDGPRASKEILSETGGRTIVASMRAHGTGKNLQVFTKHLYTYTSGSSGVWDQALGRSHRRGQTQDVEAWIYLYTPEQRAAFRKALKRALFTENLTTRPKLRIATKTFSIDPEDKET